MNRYAPPKARVEDVTSVRDNPRTLKLLGEWSKQHYRHALLLAFVPMIVGITTDRLVGGSVAFYAGSIQFIGLVLYLFWALIALLCWPYGPRLTAFTTSPPLVVMRVLVLILGLCFTVFCVGFTIVRMVSHES